MTWTRFASPKSALGSNASSALYVRVGSGVTLTTTWAVGAPVSTTWYVSVTGR